MMDGACQVINPNKNRVAAIRCFPAFIDQLAFQGRGQYAAVHRVVYRNLLQPVSSNVCICHNPKTGLTNPVRSVVPVDRPGVQDRQLLVRCPCRRKSRWQDG